MLEKRDLHVEYILKKILRLHKNSHIFPVGEEWKLLFFQRRQLYDQQAYENMFSIISYHRYTNTKIKWSVTFTSNKMTILKKTEKNNYWQIISALNKDCDYKAKWYKSFENQLKGD